MGTSLQAEGPVGRLDGTPALSPLPAWGDTAWPLWDKEEWCRLSPPEGAPSPQMDWAAQAGSCTGPGWHGMEGRAATCILISSRKTSCLRGMEGPCLWGAPKPGQNLEAS